MTVKQIQRRAAWSADHVRDARTVIRQCVELLRRFEREELADALELELGAVGADVEAKVVLAGEFKSGKTALINALIGEPLLIPSPDRASSVPVVIRHGKERRFLAVDERGGARTIDLTEFQRTAMANPDSLGDLAFLEAELPSQLLAAGLVFVDTPNLSGGLGSVSAGMVTGFVAASNALLLVSDASQEFTAAQAEFIQLTAKLGRPAIVCALTKSDLYPAADRIKEVNQRRLEELGMPSPVLPVSSTLHAEGVLFEDHDLIDESGIEVLRWYLSATLLADALQEQTRRALLAAVAILDEARSSMNEELAAAGDQATAARLEAELLDRERLQERLSANMQSDLQHELSTFQTDVSNTLERALTDEFRPQIERLIERGDPLHGWPAIREEIITIGNRITIDHLARLDRGLEEAIARLTTSARIDARELGLDKRPDVGAGPGELTVGDLGTSGRYRITNFEIGRGAMGGLMSAAGTVTILGGAMTMTAITVTAAVLVPLSGVAGMVGLVASLKSSLDRRRETDVEESRRQAKEAGVRYVGALGRELRDHSKRYSIAVSKWAIDGLTTQRESTRRRVSEDIDRLRTLKAENDDAQRRLTAEHREAIEQLTTNLQLIKRLTYTLERPEMAPVRR